MKIKTGKLNEASSKPIRCGEKIGEFVCTAEHGPITYDFSNNEMDITFVCEKMTEFETVFQMAIEAGGRVILDDDVEMTSDFETDMRTMVAQISNQYSKLRKNVSNRMKEYGFVSGVITGTTLNQLEIYADDFKDSIKRLFK